nr:hypothetical protein [Micromonospora sp. DSM 115978]
MASQPIPPADAAQALAEIDARRDQVVVATRLPAWYLPSIGVGAIGIVAGFETERGWLMPAASAVALVGGMAFTVSLVRRGVAQGPSLLFGVRDLLALVTAFIVMPLLVGTGVGLGLYAAGAPVPATLGTVAGALTLSVAGPLLIRHLRRRLTRLPSRPAR